ncbi:MAG: Vi polysaccharide biosynthesis UDP-N-acetylglucosamine C-6 dehydrogenase TviB [Burkholderiales bacterium]|nr:Vi polysaccharide biosynthesis UDP-N-acetylglucosamine C-6 dehydrogenase TviB [Burkholderiales bacterium]
MTLIFDPRSIRIGVIGLGYVGLPLAVEFARKYAVVGFDVKQSRIDELRRGEDGTREVEPADMSSVVYTLKNPATNRKQPTNSGQAGLMFSSAPADLAPCNVYIVTVPTPIDRYKRPDLSPLLRASETLGKVLKPGNVVIYESTVYPGATEEDCVPVLEKHSGLKLNGDFYAGYSPERINPGDKEHRLPSIKKVTSGSTPGAADFVDQLYASIITAGTHRASSIKVAEAAKVIENTQRDVNIALINELALICNRLGIDTQEVLAAAGTKWNFLPFRPGLVGGHCIGVDPYYLTHKAQELGYHPEVILAGRRINDNMGFYVAAQVVKLMAQKGIAVAGSRILVMGLAFKENCPDVRNTRVVDIVSDLVSYNIRVDVYDPWVNPEEARHEYGISPVSEPEAGAYDVIIIAVAHDQFKAMGAAALRALGKQQHVLYDLKYALTAGESDLRL